MFPRFYNVSITQFGTVCILLFWVAMLVILPDFVKGYEVKKFVFREFSSFTFILLSITFSVSAVVLLTGNYIFTEDSSVLINYCRKFLYLLNPLICFCWVPVVYHKKRKEYFMIVFFLVIGMATVLVVPGFLDNIKIGQYLNNLTANISSNLLSFAVGMELYVSKNTFYNDKLSIIVNTQCGASPQIFLSLFTVLIFYICCKIKSYIRINFVLLFSIIISFSINSIRIAMLGYFVNNNNIKLFDFWHEGFGSLIFSFITMFITCTLYYKIWERENLDDAS